jgi:hypothetical protein
MGFSASKNDTSLFIYHSSEHTAYLLLYVDDIVLTAFSPAFLSHVISTLSSEFSMTNLGPLSHFLGICVTRSSSGLHLSQKQYDLDLIQQTGMTIATQPPHPSTPTPNYPSMTVTFSTIPLHIAVS